MLKLPKSSDIGVAVAIPGGLITPIIRSTARDQTGFDDLERR